MKKIGLGAALLAILSWVGSTVIEPTVKTATTEIVKTIFSEYIKGPTTEGYTEPTTEGYTEPTTEGYTEPTTEGYTEPTTEGYTEPTTEGYTEVSKGSGSIDEPVTDKDEVIKEFNLANKYIIQAGEFKLKSGAERRLKEVQIKYPSAYIDEFEKQIGNQSVKFYKIIIEKDESLSASEIYDKSDKYHKNLLEVVTDEIGIDEKLAFPIIENKYVQEELESIEEYIDKKEFDEAKERIIVFATVMELFITDEFNGYKMYTNNIKNILDREENKNLKLEVEDIYNNL